MPEATPPEPTYMSDYASYSGTSTEEVSPWCPRCDPDYKPLDNRWMMCYCPMHSPSDSGDCEPQFTSFHTDDDALNRIGCAAVHRSPRP